MDKNYKFIYKIIFIIGMVCFSIWGIKDFMHKKEIHRLLQVQPSDTIMQVQSNNLNVGNECSSNNKSEIVYSNLNVTNIENSEEPVYSQTRTDNKINEDEEDFIYEINDKQIYSSSSKVLKKKQRGIKFDNEDELFDEDIKTVEVIDLQDKFNGNLDNLQLLARLIQSEAGQEQYEGKLAVGNVVLNRAKENNESIENVIYEKNQFDGINTNNFYTEPNEDSINAAKEVLNGKKIIDDDSYYFVNLEMASPSWAKEKTFVARIGNHWFFRKE